MLDIMLEFLVYFFGDKAFKKLRSRLKNRKLKRSERSDPNLEGMGISKANKVTLCTGCSRPFKLPPVYVQEKPWCPDCYKSSILKIHENK